MRYLTEVDLNLKYLYNTIIIIKTIDFDMKFIILLSFRHSKIRLKLKLNLILYIQIAAAIHNKDKRQR